MNIQDNLNNNDFYSNIFNSNGFNNNNNFFFNINNNNNNLNNNNNDDDNFFNLILENNNNNENESLIKENNNNNNNENNSTILSISIKNKKRKKIKIKSYCRDCFQFFENGPYSKICKNHIKKICNVIPCQKNNENNENLNNENNENLNNENKCIRLFPNKNSANRHTHCVNKNEVKKWKNLYEIKNCLLGNKRNLEKKKDENSKENSKEKNDLNNNNNNNNIVNMIEKFDNLNFNDKNEENKKLNDDLTIEKFFNLIQKKTFISNNIKKKLIKGFKKKGILNLRILKLYYEKNNKNWNFLIEKFNNITTQIEGVSLCIEYLLK